MKEIKCTIIRDILPLYVDEVVSQDTKKMVDEHLQHCDKCRKEYEFMKRDLYIPVDNKDSLLSNISKKWRKKKVMIIIASILGIVIINLIYNVFFNGGFPIFALIISLIIYLIYLSKKRKDGDR